LGRQVGRPARGLEAGLGQQHLGLDRPGPPGVCADRSVPVRPLDDLEVDQASGLVERGGAVIEAAGGVEVAHQPVEAAEPDPVQDGQGQLDPGRPDPGVGHVGVQPPVELVLGQPDHPVEVAGLAPPGQAPDGQGPDCHRARILRREGSFGSGTQIGAGRDRYRDRPYREPQRDQIALDPQRQ
jgi:hypothetical protein